MELDVHGMPVSVGEEYAWRVALLADAAMYSGVRVEWNLVADVAAHLLGKQVQYRWSTSVLEESMETLASATTVAENGVVRIERFKLCR